MTEQASQLWIMTPAQIERVANEMRVTLQQQTCCPSHATEVLLLMLASFVLDDASDDRNKASSALRRTVKELANDIELGRYSVLRAQ